MTNSLNVNVNEVEVAGRAVVNLSRKTADAGRRTGEL
jgi:hypothetical protein